VRVSDHSPGGRLDRSRPRRRWARVLDGDVDVVWTDRLTPHEALPGGRRIRARKVPSARRPVHPRIAYDIDLFEEGSVANLTSSDHRQRLRLQGAARGCGVEDMRIPPHICGPSRAAARDRHGSVKYLDKFGRPLLGADDQAQVGCPPAYGRSSYEALRRWLDFTKDDENINSQPFMRWRDRLHPRDGAGQPCYRPSRVRIKGHYSERHRGDQEDMYERAEFAKNSARDHHDGSHCRLHCDAVDVQVGARQRRVAAPPSCRARVPTPARRSIGVSFRVLAKWCRDNRRRSHPCGTVVGQGSRATRARQGLTTTSAASATTRLTPRRACTSTRTGIARAG